MEFRHELWWKHPFVFQFAVHDTYPSIYFMWWLIMWDIKPKFKIHISFQPD